MRDTIAAPGDPATKHLGEAETIALISCRRLDAYVLTDDRDATTLAAYASLIRPAGSPSPF